MSDPQHPGGRTRTHYEILGLSVSATTEQVRRAYRQAARSAHPDRGGSSESFLLVSTAYQILIDPRSRERYDREIGTGRGTGTAGTSNQEQGPRNIWRAGAEPTSSSTSAPDPLRAAPVFVPAFSHSAPFGALNQAQAQQQIFGELKEPRGLRSLRRGATRTYQAGVSTISWLHKNLLEHYPAGRLIVGPTVGTDKHSPVPIAVLGGTRLALIYPIPVAFDALNWNGTELVNGSAHIALTPLQLHVMDTALTLPEVYVAGWALALDGSSNPFSPTVTDMRPSRVRQEGPAALTPTNLGSLVRSLRTFFSEGTHPHHVDLNLLHTLRIWSAGEPEARPA